MKEMHNIRLDVQLREQIKTRAANCGNAWTKQLQLDLSALYDVENPIESEPAQLTLLRNHAKSCGITVQDLLERCISIIKIQPVVPQENNDSMDVERFRQPMQTTIPSSWGFDAQTEKPTAEEILAGVRSMSEPKKAV